jgi:hypothetical protein
MEMSSTPNIMLLLLDSGIKNRIPLTIPGFENKGFLSLYTQRTNDQPFQDEANKKNKRNNQES